MSEACVRGPSSCQSSVSCVFDHFVHINVVQSRSAEPAVLQWRNTTLNTSLEMLCSQQVSGNKVLVRTISNNHENKISNLNKVTWYRSEKYDVMLKLSSETLCNHAAQI